MTRAVILAGGYGTRMRPLTNRRPKHLLPVGNEPVIVHQIRKLADSGVTDVVLATAYQADAFRPVLGDGSHFGVQLTYAHEPQPMGTAGALRNALVGLNGSDLGSSTESVVVLNGDLMTEHDIQAQVQAHQVSQAVVTLHVRHVQDARPFGLVDICDARVTRFSEKPTNLQAGYINAGTYVVNPRVLADVPADAPSSLERDVFPAVASRGEMGAYREEAHFADIGTPQALLEANLRWAQQRGETSVILSDQVDASATIESSLVMPGARVDAGARLYRTIVAPGAIIGSDARLSECVIADEAQVEAHAHLTGTTLDVSERG